jgi:hypothetical protein
MSATGTGTGGNPIPTGSPLISGIFMALLAIALIVTVIVCHILNAIPYLWNLLLISLAVALILTATGAVTQIVITKAAYAITLAGGSAAVALILWGMSKLAEDSFTRVIVHVPNTDISKYQVFVSIVGAQVLSTHITELGAKNKVKSFEFAVFSRDVARGRKLTINLSLDANEKDDESHPREVGFSCINITEVSNFRGYNEPLEWTLNLKDRTIYNQGVLKRSIAKEGECLEPAPPDKEQPGLASNGRHIFAWIGFVASARAQGQSSSLTDDEELYNRLGSLVSATREEARSALVNEGVSAFPFLYDSLKKSYADFIAIPGRPAEYHRLVGILFIFVQILEQGQDNISAFRNRQGGISDIVDILSDISSHPDKTLRLRAGQVLVNVLDNRDVPRVLQQAFKTDSINGKYNLIFAVRQVASYACKENLILIASELPRIREQIASPLAPPQTTRIINETLQRAISSPNRNQPCQRA